MTSSNSTIVYLISGANRGIGFALTEILSKRSNHVIYAGVRNPNGADKLKQLSQERPGAIKIVKLTSGSSIEAKAVADQISREIGYVNTVIANAGITIHEAEAKTKDSVYPILKQAPRGAKFINISSRVGAFSTMQDYPQDASAYGVSKAAINYLMSKTHFETENEGFVVFPICPNWTNTEMGNGSATKHGMQEAPTKLEDSVNGLIQVFDQATREIHGGKFWSEKGELLQW